MIKGRGDIAAARMKAMKSPAAKKASARGFGTSETPVDSAWSGRRFPQPSDRGLHLACHAYDC